MVGLRTRQLEGSSTMSVFYKVAYTVGLTPWEDMATLPIARQIASLLDREERERQRPLGSALDLGCGRGIWTIELARRGWRVTGVDIVPKALDAARRRVEQAGVQARLVQGDLADLRAADIGSDFQLIIDFGAIHGLRNAQRLAAGREVSAVAAPGATMVLLAWAPARRGPLPRGMSRETVQEIFPEWDLIEEEPGDVSEAPSFVQKARPVFYRLRHR